MRRIGTVSAAFVLLALVVVASRAQGKDEVLGFSTPSKNIGCEYARFDAQPNAPAFPAELRCDVGTGLRPKPAKPHGCDLDWGDSLEMRKTGRVGVVCHGDTALGSKHILGYGQTWRHDGFTCVSRLAGLTCKNLSGHGFFLSRQRSRVF
jgi:hypothetical protein